MFGSQVIKKKRPVLTAFQDYLSVSYDYAGIQNFSKFRLPRVLKKVETTSARLDHKYVYDNQQNLFFYVFSNHFSWWKHFACFVSRMSICSSAIIQRDSNICIWMLWFETGCFNWILCQREELYAIGKQKVI